MTKSEKRQLLIELEGDLNNEDYQEFQMLGPLNL